ncbi:hypothetical protein [Luteimonas sp. FCS-9]|uniref:hypothetical protein n=1 Tax=Luteimonas sp. FCS-9 TaxID=1547516 RepID=UPI00063E75A7|nr:hypothetical protein [Luteimonas sp. FCS-9]KLI99947.1 hypothetical protein WQ56_11240 [Luteimonas sp. FCS-9]
MSGSRIAARRLGPLAAALLVLAGCSEAPVPARGPEVVSAPPPPEALPGCDAVGAALGDLVAGLEPVDPAGAREDTPDAYSLSCTWRASDGAAFGAIVIVDHQPLTEADMPRAGLYVDDPRVAALGGFIAYPDGRLDGAEALGPVGPQVIVGPVTVTLASNARGAVAQVTLDRAIDGAVAVHRLMR